MSEEKYRAAVAKIKADYDALVARTNKKYIDAVARWERIRADVLKDWQVDWDTEKAKVNAPYDRNVKMEAAERDDVLARAKAMLAEDLSRVLDEYEAELKNVQWGKTGKRELPEGYKRPV